MTHDIHHHHHGRGPAAALASWAAMFFELAVTLLTAGVAARALRAAAFEAASTCARLTAAVAAVAST